MAIRRLLLADDSVTIQKVVNLTFAEEGIEVITAGDGDSAMEKFVQSPPDLVMVDVNMPGIDGYKICEIIKQDEETRHIPVILLVGSFEPFDEAEARRVGADDFLTKPFQSIRQLVAKVSDLLNNSNGISASANQPENAPEVQSPPIENANSNEFATAREIEFPKFNDSGMDDDMIQTDQIGSLPADETHKFVSAANLQSAQNNNANQLEDIPQPSIFEPSETAHSQAETPESGEHKISADAGEIFQFSEQSYLSPPDGVLPASENFKMNEENKFPEYSSETEKPAENDGAASTETQSSDGEQSPDDSFFAFDDLNLLELPSIEPQKPTDQLQEKPEISETVQNRTATAETESAAPTAALSPEVIEAITKRIMEKLSDRVVREIAQELTPQAVESAISDVAQKKGI